MRTTKRTGVVVFLAGLFGVVAAAWALADAGATAASGKALAAMDSAAKTNKYLFVFFWSSQDQHTSAMQGVLQAAIAKMADRADALAISVDDPAEQAIVEQFGVRGAPLPLVLAIAPTGAVTRAFPKRFDEAQLQEAFVTPCTARCMRAIQDRHSILLCVQNGKTQFHREAMQGIQAFKADPEYAQGTEVVVLNPADQAEQPFLKALQVDPQTTAAITLLVTPPGAPVARFVGAVTKAEIEAKVKEAQSNCGPNCKCHK